MKKVLFAALAAFAFASISAPAFALTDQEQAELEKLLFKRAQEVLPVPHDGTAKSISETKQVGTSPEGCHVLVDTKHDPKTHGTYQIWRRLTEEECAKKEKDPPPTS